MQNNEIIKRLQFILGVDDGVIAQCFSLGDCDLPLDKVQAFLIANSEQDDDIPQCSEEQLGRFLNGLIIWRRGPSDSGVPAVVTLNNNIIIKKIRIALELQSRDLDNAFMLSDCELSPHEISALFRKPGTKHYVECSDHIFERLLSGLSLYFRS